MSGHAWEDPWALRAPGVIDAARAHLARMAEVSCSGWACHAERAVREPMRPCSSCRGAVGRPCSVCRGLGRVRMSLDEIRDAYALLRERGCERLRCGPRDFDDLARARVLEEDSPGHWLEAARELLRAGG